MKHCFVTLGRIAENDEKRSNEILNFGVYELMSEVTKRKDLDLDFIEALIKSLYSMILNENGLNKFVEDKEIINRINNFINEENIKSKQLCQNYLNLLFYLNQKKIRFENEETEDFIQKMIDILNFHKENKLIVENSIKTLILIASNNSLNIIKMLKKKLTNSLIQIGKENSQTWRKISFLILKLFDLIIQSNSKEFKENLNMEV